MKYKLTPAERAARIEKRQAERAEKTSRRQNIIDWFTARRELAEKRRKEAAAAPVPGARGVDRVPARYRSRPRPIEYVAEHHDLPRAERRARGILASSGNTPHTNPGRDQKRHARLRKELQS